MLNPSLIAKNFTLAEIEANIILFQDMLINSTPEKKYVLDTTQGRQDVENHTPESITELLNAYMKAKCILLETAGPTFYSGNYTGMSRNYPPGVPQ